MVLVDTLRWVWCAYGIRYMNVLRARCLHRYAAVLLRNCGRACERYRRACVSVAGRKVSSHRRTAATRAGGATFRRKATNNSIGVALMLADARTSYASCVRRVRSIV